MKKRSLLLLFLLIFSLAITSAQNRGDLINVNLIASWTPDDQKNYVLEQLGTELPIDEGLVNAILEVLANYVHSYNINIYKVRYWTEDLAGNAVQATGAMTIPQSDHGKTMILFGRGHVYDESDVFSNLRSGGGSNLFATLYSMIDFIVMVPDYIGCGDGEGREKGFNHNEGANAMVDMYRAGLQVTDQLSVKRNEQVFVGGYSQGGGNAMATIRYLQETGLIWDELPVHSAIFGGGPYDFSNTTLNYSLSIDENIDPEYYFIFCRGADDAGFDIYDDPHNYITPEYWDEWDYYIANDAIRKENIPTQWKTLFLPEALENMSQPGSQLFEYAKTLDVYDWRNHISILMTYGTADTEVPHENTLIAQEAIRNQVPIENFWEKWLVNTTNFGEVDHRTAGAYTLLASLVEFGLHRDAHNIANPFNYFKDADQSKDIPQPLFRSNLSAITPQITLNSGLKSSASSKISDVKAFPITVKGLGKEINFTGNVLDMTAVEPGFYAIEATVNGERKMELYNRKNYELITEDDNIDGYFPLQQKDGIWNLDLSYLENATQVTIFDQDKKSVNSYSALGEKEVSFPGLNKGIYTVEVLTNKTAFYIELKNTADIIDNNTITYLQNTNELLVSLESEAAKIKTIEVINIKGQLVQTISKVEESSVKTDIELQPGIYIVKASLSDDSFITRKIVVKGL